jgi:acyl-CoA thioesterase-1
MKKGVIFYLVALGLAINLLVLGCANSTSGNTDDGTLETTCDDIVVCFGNSLTAGYGATTVGEDDATKAYPEYLQDKINMPVINAGKSGDTTKGALSRVKTDVLSKNPKIVIIELGANDLFDIFLSQGTEINSTSIINLINSTKKNLQSIIKLLVKNGRKIYVAKFYTEEVAIELASSRGITNPALQTMMISQYNSIFDALASQENNVEVIEDIWAGVWGINMSDEVHPNGKGYKIMADNYFNAMQPYLQEQGLIK